MNCVRFHPNRIIEVCNRMQDQKKLHRTHTRTRFVSKRDG